MGRVVVSSFCPGFSAYYLMDPIFFKAIVINFTKPLLTLMVSDFLNQNQDCTFEILYFLANAHNMGSLILLMLIMITRLFDNNRMKKV